MPTDLLTQWILIALRHFWYCLKGFLKGFWLPFRLLKSVKYSQSYSLNEVYDSKILTAFYPQTNRQIEKVNQELEWYLRMFINYRQEQWPDWLEIAEFVYNNKAHSSTKILPFKADYRQDPRMGFEVRKKRKYKGTEKKEQKSMSIK